MWHHEIVVKHVPRGVARAQSTQRFAVGTVGHKVVIFDIKLGGVWRTLIGHTNAITCVGFSSDGRYLLSYSADESAVRVWNVSACAHVRIAERLLYICPEN